jgi:hypothetical protein
MSTEGLLFSPVHRPAFSAQPLAEGAGAIFDKQTEERAGQLA